ncbi:hypothetical protein TTHERM_00480150 (macronuclear) [Tetrahymena thermophila SB210]|uniref:Transmembrane protein n=1 Tax=Tetrahymena thermophila (strain SB210) TaxID=312017 RepID=I7MEM1_TETTS|nr:hypothetical protein TTHERM_00480150 [Tetrahymena thermophila SB210]EAR97180.1 hypothetical protein TTHERM_00480150 [Tetrahymena thermophila SB210]|eukprot:XP_001017425.1 hypothetical protein TTHERM_00480150 [Tetrahymena thermophila SB210]
MRKSLIILIVASALLVSFVESKKQIRKIDPDETQDIPILLESGLESTSYNPTIYYRDNIQCMRACTASFGNNVSYYYYGRYICCNLGLSDGGDGWYWMSCQPLSLNCYGN